MSTSDQQDLGLFAGTSWFYSRYRFGYPTAVFDFLIERFQIASASVVLDLGCGTGQIAIPLAQRGIAVRAVDPDTDMLAEGIRTEARMRVSGVQWQRGNDRELERLGLPKIQVGAMGASFHWMNRDTLLAQLDGVIADTGGIAILSSGKGQWSGATSDWGEISKEVIAEFLGPERRAGSGIYSHPKDRHEVVLSRSPFGKVETRIFSEQKELSIEDIIGFQLSTSYASPVQLSHCLEAFKRTLHERLSAAIPSGKVVGSVSYEVIIGNRP